MSREDTTETEEDDLAGLGAFIRSQRRLAALSQRELAKLADLSDPYVSQIERGLHSPSIRVLRSLAKALNVPSETMLAYAGWLEERSGTTTDDADPPPLDAESAIRADPHLSHAQKQSLIDVYRAFRAGDSEE